MSDRIVHLEGMGVVGSLVALHLDKQGIDFSWHDSNEDICAWRASTGGVYPTGDRFEHQAYAAWSAWAESEWAEGVVEKAAFWFLTKNPPHGGQYRIRHSVGPLNVGADPSYQVNAQRLVTQTRRRFEHRQDAPNGNVLVTHGFGPRLHHYVWGWHAKVSLDIDPRILEISAPLRPCFYLRTDRYTLSYAYPVPGDPKNWYGGSSTVHQKVAKPLTISPKLSHWAAHVREATRGLISMSSAGDLTQGWRPCPGPNDNALLRRIYESFHVRPMSHSGIRLAPHLVNAVVEVVG